MGGEVLLMMEKGEVSKLKKFLNENDHFEKDDDDGIFSSSAPIEDTGCWIEFQGGASLEVGHQVFHMCSNWATAIACGIVKKFKVKKGGWDSVGYSDDFFKSRPFQCGIDIANRHIKKNPGKDHKTIKDQIEEDTKYQKLYEDKVKEIFQL